MGGAVREDNFEVLRERTEKHQLAWCSTVYITRCVCVSFEVLRPRPTLVQIQWPRTIVSMNMLAFSIAALLVTFRMPLTVTAWLCVP